MSTQRSRRQRAEPRALLVLPDLVWEHILCALAARAEQAYDALACCSQRLARLCAAQRSAFRDACAEQQIKTFCVTNRSRMRCAVRLESFEEYECVERVLAPRSSWVAALWGQHFFLGFCLSGSDLTRRLHCVRSGREVIRLDVHSYYNAPSIDVESPCVGALEFQ